MIKKLIKWWRGRFKSVIWEEVREEILQEVKVEVASIPTKNYKEVIEIRVPIRFYWDEDGFDGIEFGEFHSKLLPWQDAMVAKCLEAIVPSLHTEHKI